MAFAASWPRKHTVNLCFGLFVTFLCFTVPLFLDDVRVAMEATPRLSSDVDFDDLGSLLSFRGVKRYLQWWFGAFPPRGLRRDRSARGVLKEHQAAAADRSALDDPNSFRATLAFPGDEVISRIDRADNARNSMLHDPSTFHTSWQLQGPWSRIDAQRYIHFCGSVAARDVRTGATAPLVRIVEVALTMAPVPMPLVVGVAGLASELVRVAAWSTYLFNGRRRPGAWRPGSDRGVVDAKVRRVVLFAPGTSRERHELHRALRYGGFDISIDSGEPVAAKDDAAPLRIGAGNELLGVADETLLRKDRDRLALLTAKEACLVMHNRSGGAATASTVCSNTTSRGHAGPDVAIGEPTAAERRIVLTSWSAVTSASSVDLVILDFGPFAPAALVMAMRASLPLLLSTAEQSRSGKSLRNLFAVWYGPRAAGPVRDQAAAQLRALLQASDAALTLLGPCVAAAAADALRGSSSKPIPHVTVTGATDDDSAWDRAHSALSATSSRDGTPSCILWAHARGELDLSRRILQIVAEGSGLSANTASSSQQSGNLASNQVATDVSPPSGWGDWLFSAALLAGGVGVGAVLLNGVLKNLRARKSARRPAAPTRPPPPLAASAVAL